MRRGKIGIHSCCLTPERGVRYGLRRYKIALFRVHILFKKFSNFFYTIHTISSCFMDII